MLPFTYDLDQERIAQRPVDPPESAKLCCFSRSGNLVQDKTFFDLPSFLNDEHVLVFNNTKVVPARFFGVKENSNTKVEILLIRELRKNVWECMAKPLKKLKDETFITFSENLRAKVLTRVSERTIELEFLSKEDINTQIKLQGLMPIPPYIREGKSDKQDNLDYQSIFASFDGSIAAPTASLHFTESLVEKVKASGALIDFVTLHVGSASFLSIFDEKSQVLLKPGVESYKNDPELLAKLLNLKKSGKKIISVGTTVVRALESLAVNTSKEKKFIETDLFITPGYEFKVVDGLITNFHQPGSTHLLLVEAFLEAGRIKDLYNHAIKQNYRFLSYGDACYIV